MPVAAHFGCIEHNVHSNVFHADHGSQLPPGKFEMNNFYRMSINSPVGSFPYDANNDFLSFNKRSFQGPAPFEPTLSDLQREAVNAISHSNTNTSSNSSLKKMFPFLTSDNSIVINISLDFSQTLRNTINRALEADLRSNPVHQTQVNFNVAEGTGLQPPLILPTLQQFDSSRVNLTKSTDVRNNDLQTFNRLPSYDKDLTKELTVDNLKYTSSGDNAASQSITKLIQSVPRNNSDTQLKSFPKDILAKNSNFNTVRESRPEFAAKSDMSKKMHWKQKRKIEQSKSRASAGIQKKFIQQSGTVFSNNQKRIMNKFYRVEKNKLPQSKGPAGAKVTPRSLIPDNLLDVLEAISQFSTTNNSEHDQNSYELNAVNAKGVFQQTLYMTDNITSRGLLDISTHRIQMYWDRRNLNFPITWKRVYRRKHNCTKNKHYNEMIDYSDKIIQQVVESDEE